MGKQNVAYTVSGILFSLKKEGHADMCLNFKDVMLSRVSQTPKYKNCTIPPGIVQFTDTANGMVIVWS